jgi:hypothetical protein
MFQAEKVRRRRTVTRTSLNAHLRSVKIGWLSCRLITSNVNIELKSIHADPTPAKPAEVAMQVPCNSTHFHQLPDIGGRAVCNARKYREV